MGQKKEKQRRFTVRYRQDEGGSDNWCVTVAEVPEVATYGRTLGEARRHALEAIQLALEDDDVLDEQLEDEVGLPASVMKAVASARDARALVEAAKERSSASTQRAATLLLEHGVGVRDAGALLGLTFQRVHQIATAARAASPALKGRKRRRLARARVTPAPR